MEFIPAIYYINLDYRTDRKLQFMDWLLESEYPEHQVHRISAIHVPGRGHLGALQSHIKTLETFLASNHARCMIFEDDYHPLDISVFWQSISQVFTTNIVFDVVMLAYNVLESTPTQFPFLHRVSKSFTASGFIITREFASKLLENFKEALIKLLDEEEKTKRKANQYCLDVYWHSLMNTSQWYCIYPRLGKQHESYSDIEQVYANYNG
jgi:hypothetical protein